ncbi:MAG TPA: CocE/NonD family hydrolase [Burkholderiales bacterium]|nr:CocE/NonD family hydrolase [Burkholderiales bacterium]
MASNESRTLNETRVEFRSQGATLRGYLLTRAGAPSRLPAVIMAHGTSATLAMVAIEYARVFATAGLAVLIYDHRNVGSSDGEPRFEINPWIQCRGYLDAVSFASSRTEVDLERIGLWGDSYTGGQVIVVSACDPRPKVVIAQCPVFGAALPPIEPSPETLAVIKRTLLSGDVTGTPETTAGPLPVVSADQLGTPSLLTPIQAFRWFIDYGGRPGSGWVNRVIRVIPPTPVTYSPYLCAPFVQAKVLLMVAPEDEMPHANYQVTKRAFELMPGFKRWYDIADGHFGLLYHPGERFDEAASVQAQFLREQLDT